MRLWKIKREIGRIGQQFRALPESIYEPWRQRIHDRSFDAGFPTLRGSLPVGKKVAILLLYQPRGVAKSIFLTCKHLISRGYVPFIVSNCPLTDVDRQQLGAMSWCILERPNFGYDFGGYRDGIKYLWKHKIVPEHLIIMNDSIWFPLNPNEQFIEKLEASDAGISGSVLRNKKDRLFLESYFYHVPKATFKSESFCAYWSNLRLTSNKYKVIRRGEYSHSQSLIGGGLTLDGIFDRKELFDLISGEDDQFIGNVLKYESSFRHELDIERKAILKLGIDSISWRQQALDHIERALRTEQFYSHFPYASVMLLNYPILKKSKDRVSQMWRLAYLRAVDDGLLPLPEQTLLDEFRELTPDYAA